MKSCFNLGLTTSAERADQCSRVCTRGVQGIRPGVLRNTRHIGRGSPVGTAHGSLLEIQGSRLRKTSLDVKLTVVLHLRFGTAVVAAPAGAATMTGAVTYAAPPKRPRW
jgi:hypothetical protein